MGGNIMKKGVLLFLLVTLGLGLFLGDVPSAQAQSSGTDEFTLEEITVTAQKREENQQKVPTAMEVISGSELSEYARNDINEILSTVSSALVNKSSDGLRIAIRGIVQDNQPFFGIVMQNPAVAMNTDGVYSNRNSSGQNLFDIERVEVLYGPQSTMYASATPGGIVNIITNDPKTGEYEFLGTFEYGNYDLTHVEGVANVPMGDKWALRMGFTSSLRDGYLSNGAEDENSRVGRLKLLFEPSNRFSFLVSAEQQKISGQGYVGVIPFADQDDVDDPWISVYDPQPPRFTNIEKFYGRINVGLGFGDLSIVPSYGTKDFIVTVTTVDDLDGPFSPGTEKGEIKSVNQGKLEERGLEVRITSSADSTIKWIAGANYYKSMDEGFSDEYHEGVHDYWGYRYNWQKSKVVYGNVTYPITDLFRTTVGSRYTWENNESVNNEYRNAAWVYEGVSQEYNKPDFKIGIEYDLADDKMVYADWSSGYRTNGGTNKVFPPEKLQAYTIGSKNRFFENRFQLNAAAYYYDYKNKFAMAGVKSIVDENGNGVKDPEETWVRPDSDNRTVGRQIVYGMDLQTSTIITSKDKMDLSISYCNKTWKSLFFDYWAITNSMGMEDLDFSGKTATFAPLWNIQLSYNHNFHLQNSGTITTRFDARYQSGYRLEIPEYRVQIQSADNPVFIKIPILDLITQEGYVLYDFSAVYANPNGKWTLTAYGKNLTNYAVKRNLRDVVTSGIQDMMIGPPRTYGLSLSIKY